MVSNNRMRDSRVEADPPRSFGDWREVTLGDHVRFLRTGSHSRAQLGTDGPVQYLHYGDIHKSVRVHLDASSPDLPRLGMDQAQGLDRLEIGDLVLVDASEDLDGVGKSVEIAGVSKAGAVAGLHTIAARFDRAVLADGFKAYLQFCPEFRRHLRRLAAGTKVLATHRDHIRSVEVRLPQPNEQRAIAQALEDAERLSESLERLIAKKRDIKQATMQQLLIGRTRLPGFSVGWSRGRIGDLLRVRHGKSQKDIEDAAGRYPILASGGRIGWTNTPIHPGPSVLIGRKGTIDRPQYSDGPFWTIDTLFYTENSDGVVPRFMFYLFQMIDWCSLNEASGVPSLSATRVESVIVDYPATSEQQAIADVLTDMDTELEILHQRLAKSRDLKIGMMQQLLTGRTRLIAASRGAA